MAEEVSASNHSNNSSEMLELSICQPDHPNQAVFVPDLNICLRDFRTKISDSSLFLPQRWLFMTRAGSLIPADQEENIQLNTVSRERDEGTGVLDILITPSQYYQRQRQGNGAAAGASPLTSFATIVAALRDIYVTTIQPNMHELIKPLVIAAGAAAVLAFIMAMCLTLAIGALGGMKRSVVVPFLRHHVCGEELEIASEMPKLYKRINELEAKMSHMRQVEVGSLVCKEDNHMYEEPEFTTIHVPFRKTSFEGAPRVVFGLRGVSMDDFNSMRLEDLKVNSTGFSVRCAYFGKWMHYNMEFSWVAVGK